MVLIGDKPENIFDLNRPNFYLRTILLGYHSKKNTDMACNVRHNKLVYVQRYLLATIHHDMLVLVQHNMLVFVRERVSLLCPRHYARA